MFTCPLSGVAYFQNRPDTTTEPPVLFSHCQCTLTRLPFNTNISSNYETLEGKKKYGTDSIGVYSGGEVKC